MILSLDRYITSDGQHEFQRGLWNNSPYQSDLAKNASILIPKVSELLDRAGVNDYVITSGWRSDAVNKAAGGSPTSHHLWARAIDILDMDKSLGQWCVNNLETLKEIGIFMESLVTTHASHEPKGRWVHWQYVAPKSGNQIFMP